MVFSPARLNLTWQYSPVVLLVWIALLSREKVRPCLREELRGKKKKKWSQETRFYMVLVLGLSLQRTSVLLLPPLNILPFIFLSFLFSVPPCPPKYSLEHRDWKTRDLSLGNVPVSKLWSCCCCLWSSECLSAKQKEFKGVAVAHPPHSALWAESDAQVRVFSPGPQWGEPESLRRFSGGGERRVGVPTVDCS